MQDTTFDLYKANVTIACTLGTRTIRNYGDKAASIEIDAPQKQANIVKTGAAGDSITLKQFDGNTKTLKISVVKDHSDDIWLKNIVATEEAGSSVVLTISYNDENLGERYMSVSGSLKEYATMTRGTDMVEFIEYIFNMPQAVHTPPSLGV